MSLVNATLGFHKDNTSTSVEGKGFVQEVGCALQRFDVIVFIDPIFD